MKNPITASQIYQLISASHPSIEQHMIHHVLQVLLNTPEFDLSTYTFKNSPFLQRPQPVNELPCGPDHVTLQFMLGSLPIPESTYEDNDRVLAALWQQMGYNTQTVYEVYSVFVAKN